MTSRLAKQYEGKFMDALDLAKGCLVPVEISSVAQPGSESDAAGKLIRQAILSFKGEDKRLILNKTNFKNLKAMFGPDEKNWIGKTVTLQRRYLDAQHAFGLENTMAIRIVPPKGTPILKSAANYMGSPTPYGIVPKKPTPPEPDAGMWDGSKYGGSNTGRVTRKEIEALYKAWLAKAGATMQGKDKDYRGKAFRTWIFNVVGREFDISEEGEWPPAGLLRCQKVLAGTQAISGEVDAAELGQWIEAVKTLSDPDELDKFRLEVLPTCPEAIRQEIEQLVESREVELKPQED